MLFITKRFLKYVVVGSSNAALGYGVYACLIILEHSVFSALLVNYVFGILYSFVLNARWVFKSLGWTKLPIFIGLHFSIMFANIWLVKFILQSFNIGEIFAQAILILPLAIFNFLILKHFIFKKKAFAS